MGLPPGKSFEVACPSCQKIRVVSRSTALALQRRPRPCPSCARKPTKVRKRISKKPPRLCPVCGTKFIGSASKLGCSTACTFRLRRNDAYFGGRMFLAEGWVKKECQVCFKIVRRGFHIHHVYGHPDHSRLVVLCAGCHEMIGRLAQRINFGSKEFSRLIEFVILQRQGHPDR